MDMAMGFPVDMVVMDQDMVAATDQGGKGGTMISPATDIIIIREINEDMVGTTTVQATTMGVDSTDDDEQCSSLFFSGRFIGIKVEKGRQAGLRA